MALRVFLRVGDDRAQRDRAADLVSAARLDLAWLVAAALVLAAGPARADGLSTLLVPHSAPLIPADPLSTPAPLATPDTLSMPVPLMADRPLLGSPAPSRQAGAGQVGARQVGARQRAGDGRAVPCPPGVRPAPLVTAGSGAGEYAPYVATGPAEPAGEASPRPAPASPALGYDRPLWGEGGVQRTPAAAQPAGSATERPLWNDGAPHPTPSGDPLAPRGAVARDGVERTAVCGDAVGGAQPGSTADTVGGQRSPY